MFQPVMFTKAMALRATEISMPVAGSRVKLFMVFLLCISTTYSAFKPKSTPNNYDKSIVWFWELQAKTRG